MYLMAIVGFLMLFRVSRPFNLWRGLLYGGLIGAFVLSVVLIGNFLQLARLSLGSWLIFGVFALLAIPVIGYFTKALDWLASQYRRGRGWAQKKLHDLLPQKQTKI